MTGYNNGHTANDDYTGFTYELEEPIAVKGFSVTYDRKFNTGNFESLNPAITIWVKVNRMFIEKPDASSYSKLSESFHAN